MRKFLTSIVLSLICVASGAQQFGFQFEGNLKKITIPVDVLNNLIVVPVVLNDQLSLKFILDTGVRTTILTQKTYSDILKLTYSKEIFVSGPGGKKAAAYVTDNVRLDLPGVRGNGHSMLVLEEDYLELRNYLGAEVHGILGYEIFSRFIVQMDYERKRLVLYAPSHFKKKRRYQPLKISIEDTKPFVTASVSMNGDVEILTKLLIDTGASHGLMLQPGSREEIVVPEPNINSTIGRTLGGIITGKIGRIGSLQLGKYKLNNPIANFPDTKSQQDTIIKKDLYKRNGALGGEVLSRFNIIFNFPQEVMYIKHNGSFKRPSNYDMSGI
ncbi:MAG TPA: retropepsin-like aspartic protease, partial [Cyclobacteriaceae bacterium]